jgi:hypothetical protein
MKIIGKHAYAKLNNVTPKLTHFSILFEAKSNATEKYMLEFRFISKLIQRNRIDFIQIHDDNHLIFVSNY